MQTANDFLEELKVLIEARINIKKEVMGDDYSDTAIRENLYILNKIKQFQAEQRVSDENS